MLVRLVGFTFKVEGKGELSLSTYAKALAGIRPEEEVAEHEHRRLLFLNDQQHHDYYAGLVVTIKDHRTFCELVNADGNLLVRVNQLQGDASLMDFNFFVINKVTGAGLYQHYHQSCSVSSFCALAARRFMDFRRIEIANALASAKTASEERKVRGLYNNRLRWEIIVRKEALSAMIAEMKRVKGLYAVSSGT